MVAPLLDLEILKISSACTERTLTFLLYQCLNVKEIYMGMTTCVSDQVFSDVLTKNSLSRLERLKIQKCSKVSNFTFSQICALCVNCGNYSHHFFRKNYVKSTYYLCKLFSRNVFQVRVNILFSNPHFLKIKFINFHTVFSHKNCTYFFVKRQLFLQ